MSFWALIIGGLAASCVTPKQRLAAPKPPPVDHIARKANVRHEAGPSIRNRTRDPNWRKKLTDAARAMNVNGIEQFENGVYGRYKQSHVFFSTTHEIPDDDKFYWVMIKVLSEKHSCLATKRRKNGDLYRFYCRDSRSVVIRRGKVNGTLHFYSRTYDRNGKLIRK